MSRVIDRKIAARLTRFLAGENPSDCRLSDNVRMEFTPTTARVFLHGSAIASIDRTRGEVRMSLCGWATTTTRARLNGVCAALSLPNRFSQRGGDQFYGPILIADSRNLVADRFRASTSASAANAEAATPPPIPASAPSAPPLTFADLAAVEG